MSHVELRELVNVFSEFMDDKKKEGSVSSVTDDPPPHVGDVDWLSKSGLRQTMNKESFTECWTILEECRLVPVCEAAACYPDRLFHVFDINNVRTQTTAMRSACCNE